MPERSDAGRASVSGPPRSAGPAGRRRLTLGVGVGLVLAGLSLLGYVGWQLVGTDVVSHRHQRQARAAVTKAWGRGHDAARTPWGQTTALIRVPRWGADYEVPVFQGTSDRVLAAGFGHFTGTAGPGQVGNFAVAAHRVTHGEPLRRMPSLRAGDEVDVVTRSTTYVYRLTSGGDDLVVPFTAGWVLDPLPRNPDGGGVQPSQVPGQRLLTLTTCSELFHTDDRLVAFGVLVDSRATEPSQG